MKSKSIDFRNREEGDTGKRGRGGVINSIGGRVSFEPFVIFAINFMYKDGLAWLFFRSFSEQLGTLEKMRRGVIVIIN